ncbi:hypothetical protein F66182_2799 [Fusarium sp. NRRL 66182]|nr:hypothetical protein F66182_2799 [Fusarium sp. NRRL 66182]
MQTINPALLTGQASNAPSYPDRPSSPMSAARLVQSSHQHPPSPSPYSSSGRQETWMGSVGFTEGFAGGTMGHGQMTWEAPFTYEAEPLESHFGILGHLQQVPSPVLEQNPAPAIDRMGGDLAWLLGRPQSQWVENSVMIHYNGEKRLVTNKFYIERRFREDALRRRTTAPQQR